MDDGEPAPELHVVDPRIAICAPHGFWENRPISKIGNWFLNTFSNHFRLPPVAKRHSSAAPPGLLAAPGSPGSWQLLALGSALHARTHAHLVMCVVCTCSHAARAHVRTCTCVRTRAQRAAHTAPRTPHNTRSTATQHSTHTTQHTHTTQPHNTAQPHTHTHTHTHASG